MDSKKPTPENTSKNKYGQNLFFASDHKPSEEELPPAELKRVINYLAQTIEGDEAEASRALILAGVNAQQYIETFGNGEKSPIIHARAYGNLGDLFNQYNHPDRALYYYEEALTYFGKANEKAPSSIIKFDSQNMERWQSALNAIKTLRDEALQVPGDENGALAQSRLPF